MIEKIFYLLLIALIWQPCLSQKAIEPRFSTSRYMPSDDPNLNPNWDWTVAGPGHRIYYQTPNNQIQSQIVQLPFYSSGHPLNTVVEKDMYPEDGWVLAYRDFGTPTSAPEMPFFGLYNKYRGILRLMFYNTREFGYNHFEMALRFVDQAHSGALLTFTDEENSFLNTYDKSREEFMMTEAAAINGWIWADFFLFGYDPNLSDLARLRVSISGINTSNISLESTEFTLNQVFFDMNPGGGRKGADLLNAINNGVKVYKTVEDFLEDMRKSVARDKSQGKSHWWHEIVDNEFGTASSARTVDNEFATAPTALPGADVVNTIGKIAGFVSTFMGGGNKNMPRMPIRFEGSIKFKGSIETSPFLIYARDLGLKAGVGNNPPDHYRVLQPISWGVFNLIKKPTLKACYTLVRPIQHWWSNWSIRVDSLDYNFNNNSDMQLQSVEGALVSSSGPINSYGGAYKPLTENKLSFAWFGPAVIYQYFDVALKMTFKINSPTRYSDDEIVVYKVIPVNGTIKSCTLPHNLDSFSMFSENKQATSSFVQYKPFPNPAHNEVTIATGLNIGSEVIVEIFDPTGHQVRELIPIADVKTSLGKVVWNLENSQGVRVPKGIYHYRVQDGKTVHSGRFVVID